MGLRGFEHSFLPGDAVVSSLLVGVAVARSGSGGGTPPILAARSGIGGDALPICLTTCALEIGVATASRAASRVRRVGESSWASAGWANATAATEPKKHSATEGSRTIDGDRALGEATRLRARSRSEC